jgi:Asp-tRNA(Asn)/Glu-tRNA(Gln) amidotransferase A subunit family amidase
MSEPEFDGAVRAAADTYGLERSEAELTATVAEAESTAEALRGLDATDPADDPATDVVAADDEYHALRYRFSLASGDGPLAGLSLGVKDNLAVAGVPMTCGSASLSYTPDFHATAVRRLVEAGGDVVATTNMDEFAFFTTGETCAHGPIANPVDEEAVPGGSSSGSGAAVAAGILDAALGTDTGGSVRIPASYCGVVGLKPTHRSVPRFGFVDLAPSLDHVGVLTSSVETAGAVFEAIGGPDPRDPSSQAAPVPDGTVDDAVDERRIGVVEEALAAADGAVAEAVEAAVASLEERGVVVDRVSLPSFDATPLALLAVSGLEFARLVADDGVVYGTGTGYSEGKRAALADLRDRGAFGENVADQLLVNGALLERSGGRHYVNAQRLRERFLADVEETLAACDGLVLPTTPTTAPSFGAVTDTDAFVRTISHTAPFNLTGHPAISVPCGAVDGRPVGCQVVGSWRDEHAVLSLGAAVERV